MIRAAGQIKISWYNTSTHAFRKTNVLSGVPSSFVQSLRMISRKSKYLLLLASSLFSLH